MGHCGSCRAPVARQSRRAAPEPRHLRAGDPETTSAAAVLAKGEAVVVPPMPGENHSALMPFRDALYRTARRAQFD